VGYNTNIYSPLYKQIRNKLQNVVGDIWTSAKGKGHLKLSDNLLLARTQKLHHKKNGCIKSAFFEFFRSAIRKI